MQDFERFKAGYIDALYFTDTGEEGQPDADTELAPEAKARISKRCAAFWGHCGPDVLKEPTQTIEQAGHDFWLTTQGHGVGFWDGGWPTQGEELTRVCDKFFKSLDTYEGDNGQIYLS